MKCFAMLRFHLVYIVCLIAWLNVITIMPGHPQAPRIQELGRFGQPHNFFGFWAMLFFAIGCSIASYQTAKADLKLWNRGRSTKSRNMTKR
jgi:hypothetical protein